MPQFISAKEAVTYIKDGDVIWSNAFLALANPIELQTALGKRVMETGSPKNLSFWCSAGFGDWTPGSPNEDFVRGGAVKELVISHFSSTPDTAALVSAGKIAAYNLPLGVMSKIVRAAAAGEEYIITDIGLNLYVDPKYDQYKINELSTHNYVTDIVIDGKRRLKYEVPKIDVAFIKGSSTDSFGNISFENESTVTDALSLAQAVKANGGTVIVQVQKIISGHQRPWNVIIPASLVDYVCICSEQKQIAAIDGYQPSYAGDVFVDPGPMRDIIIENEKKSGGTDPARISIAKHAVKHMKPGSLVNIGIGIPEYVAIEAVKLGLLEKATLTVESGAFNGVPATGPAFGAAIGPHSICNMAQQFDLYDGGGLDVCYIGALEIDKHGNVNGHYSAKKLSGIGGFANITQTSAKVVFCATFTAAGLKIEENDGQISILQEGIYPKFVEDVAAISFSAENALNNKQEIYYVTERCMFKLTEKGLTLIEVYPGVDLQKDVLDKLPFEVAIELEA